jgi:hypothetical protein
MAKWLYGGVFGSGLKGPGSPNRSDPRPLADTPVQAAGINWYLLYLL